MVVEEDVLVIRNNEECYKLRNDVIQMVLSRGFQHMYTVMADGEYQSVVHNESEDDLSVYFSFSGQIVRVHGYVNGIKFLTYQYVGYTNHSLHPEYDGLMKEHIDKFMFYHGLFGVSEEVGVRTC